MIMTSEMYRDSLLGMFRHCGGLSCSIGCFAGLTLGTPIAVTVPNTDQRGKVSFPFITLFVIFR